MFDIKKSIFFGVAVIVVGSAFFLFLPSATHADDNCVDIANASKRLACYDAQGRAAAPIGSEDLFSKFQELVYFNEFDERFSRRDFLDVGFDDCRLFYRSVTLDHKRGTTLKGGMSITPDRVEASMRQVLLNLKDVDVSKTKIESWDKSIVLTLFRGKEAIETVTSGQTKAEWSLSIEPSSEWDALAIDRATINRRFPRFNDYGTHIGPYRKVKFRFAKHWPEDAREINAAFLDVVDSCQ